MLQRRGQLLQGELGVRRAGDLCMLVEPHGDAGQQGCSQTLQRNPSGTPRVHFSPCQILGADQQLWEGPVFSAVWFSVQVPRPYRLQTWVKFG